MRSMAAFMITAALAAAVQAQTSTTFTYQGRLNFQGQPVNDPVDLEFTLWDDSTINNPLGAAVTLNNITITNGLFAVPLDFGAAVFASGPRWLQIAVRNPAGSGSFTALSPRQAITAAPYALQTRGIFVNETADRVGLGTTDPQVAFHVRRQPGTAEVARFTDQQGTSQLRLSASGGIAALQSWNGVANLVAHLILNADGGNVGIGTTAPGSKLHIVDAGWPTARIQSSSEIGTWLRLDNTSVGGRSWNVISSGAGNGEGAGKLLLNDQSGGGTRLLVNETGDVGIGTLAPAARLTVQRAAGTPEVARFVDSGSFSQLRINATSFHGEIQSWDGSGDQPAALALNAAGGNVGIGTATPQDALHIAQGAIRFPDDSRQTTAVRKVRVVQSIDFGSIQAQSTGGAILTVPGAELGASVVISPDQDLPTALTIAWARVSATNTVRFAIRNNSGAAVDPPPITFYVTVLNP